MSETLTAQEIMGAGLADWRRLARRIHARFETGDYATGAAFVSAIGEAAETVDHHP
nr:4a-hydroxytetrahydrobiopterin dehydratase [Actinomycetales bacterium]